MWTYAIKNDNKWSLVPFDFKHHYECEESAYNRWLNSEIEDYLVIHFKDDEEFWKISEQMEEVNEGKRDIVEMFLGVW